QTAERRWPIFLLCLAWGLLEAASLYGLGGTLLASVPANAVLGMTNDLVTPLTTASMGWIFFTIATALIGLLASRLWSDSEQIRKDAFDGLWLSWIMLLVLTLLVLLQPSVMATSMKAFVVGLTAVVLGFQIGTLYQINRRVESSTVSRRSSVLGVLVSYPGNLPEARRRWHIGGSLLVFLFGIWLGSELLQVWFPAIFLTALTIMLFATTLISKPFRHV
ncbi:MAG: hypothetical protein R6V42_01475, partial [Orrella sp.]